MSRHVTSTAVNVALLSSAPTHDIPVINVQISFIHTNGAVDAVQTVKKRSNNLTTAVLIVR